jgi:1-acyl-sn-glycerol-3-phosphate acyltransferase
MTKLGLDYPTGWGRRTATRTVRDLLYRCWIAPYMRYSASLDVRGLANVGRAGPLIFVANHTSNLDTPLILSSLPASVRRRTVVAAAMDSFFTNSKTAFRTVLLFNAIPFDRHSLNRRSAQQALELVRQGWNLLIYPEGGRTTDGNLGDFKGGAAYLAERSHATVIPTYVHESGWLKGPEYAKAPQFVQGPSQRRHHEVVAYGEPLHALEGESIRRYGSRI